MITRPPSTPHICLRCQRSLARRSASPAYQFAPQSTYSTLPPISEQDNPADDGHQKERDSPGLIIRRVGRPSRPSHLSARPLRPKSQLSEFPLGKLHGFQGHRLREKTEQLEHNVLGDPAKVIVLRESKFDFKDGREVIDAKEAEHVDILRQLANERGLVGQKEVEENINVFRPKEGGEPRNWHDMNKLVQELQGGFTYPQLQRYIDSFERENDTESLLFESVATQEDAPILRLTPWMPGVSEFSDYFDNSPLRGYFMESHTTKQKLVLQLLRECWRLGLQDVSEGIGQFEMQIREKDLELLLKGEPSTLAAVFSDLLAGESESIEIFRSRGVIRVTTLQYKRDVVVQAVEEAVKSIRREEIHLGDLFPASYSNKHKNRTLAKWMEKNFDDSMLLELSRITNTEIERLPDFKILISCIERRPDSTMSSRVDVAKRLLLTSLNPSNNEPPSLECDGVVESPGSFVKYTQVDVLGWRDRLRQWMRWTVPVEKEAAPKSQPVHQEETIQQLNIEQAQDKDLEPHPPTRNATPDDARVSNTSQYWNSRYSSEHSSVIGSVLHSTPNSSSPHNPLSDLRAIHSFSTLVPNLSRVLSTAEIITQDAPLSYLTLRFLPNPFSTTQDLISSSQGTGGLSAFPPLELRFSVDPETQEIKLKEIEAVVGDEKTDVMLPDNGVDIRFREKRTSRIQRQYLKDIMEFVNKSNLNLGGGILETPPKLKLSQRWGEWSDGAPLEVEYLFAGLDVRNTLVFNYEGWRLLYTSIEAGKAGGRRGELKLRPIFNGEAKLGEEFVEMAYRLARDVGGSRGKAQSDGMSTLGLGAPVRRLYSHDPLVRRRVTNKGAVDRVFRYFGKRLEVGKANESLWGDGLWDEVASAEEDEGDPGERPVDENHVPQTEGEAGSVGEDISEGDRNRSGDRPA